MNHIRMIFVLLILAVMAVSLQAQEMLFQNSRKITGSDNFSCGIPEAAWNGSEWGLLYRSYHGSEYRLYFTRLTMDGKVIGGQKLLFTMVNDWKPRYHEICADESGWGILVDADSSVPGMRDLLFYRLGKKGNKLGGPTAIVSQNTFSSTVPPVWNGSMYLVFYVVKDASGYYRLNLATLNSFGKRMKKDIRYASSLKGDIEIKFLTVTADGIALFGNLKESGNFTGYVFTRVGFDGKSLVPATKLEAGLNQSWSPAGMVWNGNNYIVAFHEGPTWNTIDPLVRPISPKGKWAGGKIGFPNFANRRNTGFTSCGDNYVFVGYDMVTTEYYYRVLDKKLKPVTPCTLIPSNRKDKFFSDIALFGNGRRLGVILSHAEELFGLGDIYYNALVMPYKGKPDIVSFEGTTVRLFGSKYALLSWRVDGVDAVTIKTKGYKGAKSCQGILLLRIRKESKFQLIAKNDSGRARAKLKITP